MNIFVQQVAKILNFKADFFYNPIIDLPYPSSMNLKKLQFIQISKPDRMVPPTTQTELLSVLEFHTSSYIIPFTDVLLNILSY